MYTEPQDPFLPAVPKITGQNQAIPTDPSLPPVPQLVDWYPGYYCDCPWPVREERAERHGAARTYCARCDRELPLRMGTT